MVGGPPGAGRRQHQQVPGVRIGVIEAVDEDLLAVGLDADARGGAAVDLEALEALEVGDLDPLHPFGGQHARRRELGHDRAGTAPAGMGGWRAAKLAAIFWMAAASRR